MRAAIAAVAAGLAVPCAAFAQASTETATAADEIFVVAPVDVARTPDPSATVHRASPERLERARTHGEDLGRILDQVAGTRVLDLGGPVAERQLTLRGGAPTQALIVVDGVPLRTPFARGFDVGLVHPELLDEVELVRGGQGASWGDGALTGVLVLGTREPADGAYQAATVVAGSQATARVSAVAVDHGLRAAVSYERTDGDFDYTLRLPGLADEDRRRANNDGQRLTFSLGGATTVLGGRLDVRGAGAFRAAGVPGLAGSPGESRVAREQTWNGRVHVGFARPVDWADGGELRLSGYGAVLDLSYQDPANALESDLRFVSGGADADLLLGFGGDHLVRGQLYVAGEGVDGPALPGRGRFAFALSDEWGLGDLLLYGALRAEVVGQQRVAILPRLGARWSLTEALSVAAAIGRSVRTPTLDELYHPVETAYSGNPDLESEQAWEAELTAAYRSRALFAQLATFARRIERTILYLNRNAFLVRPENVGGARSLGVEAEVSGQRRVQDVRLFGGAQVSLLASELERTGERLPTVPVWSFSSNVGVGWSRFEVDTALRGFGPTFVNLRPNDQNRVPAYARWDAGARARLGAHVVLGAEVLNLMDTRTLASVNRFPLPGRTFFVSLRVRSDAQSSGEKSSSK